MNQKICGIFVYKNEKTADSSDISTNRGELLNIVIWGAERCQPDLLAELGKGWIGKERNVAEQLVAHIWLRCVHRLAGVADVLGGMEDAESQSCQEIARAEQTCHWA